MIDEMNPNRTYVDRLEGMNQVLRDTVAGVGRDRDRYKKALEGIAEFPLPHEGRGEHWESYYARLVKVINRARVALKHEKSDSHDSKK